MLGGRRVASLVKYLPFRYVPGVVAALVTVAVGLLGTIEFIEYRSLEFFFELRGARQPHVPVIIVTIDEPSFIELGEPWPFPRKLHGDVVRRIAADKPLAIGVDVLFPEPSLRGPADDEALGAAVAAAGNVVLGSAPKLEYRPGGPGVAGVYQWDPNIPVPAVRRGGFVAPVQMIQDNVDAHVRRAPLRVETPDGLSDGFDTQIYRLATKAGLVGAPLPAKDSVLINFNGPPKTFPWVDYYKLVPRGGREPEVDPGFFKGKIVLIGPTSDVLHDVFATAFAHGDMQMPGVEIHANALDTYYRGNYVREIPMGISTLLAAVAALMGAALVVRLHAFRAFAIVALVWLILTVFAYLGFLYFDVWMRGMIGTAGLGLGYLATVIENFVREQREKRRLSQFFSPEVLREVVRQRDDSSLGSTRRLVTVLFSDIRGFTTLSERLEPEQVAEMLREYLSEMTEIVFRHGGTVDKYIGDCVMALYNAPFPDPDHAVKAVRTGLEFQEKTLEVSRRWEEKLGVQIRNGVGINTGEAVVGTMGSRQRLEYTAIGDTINLGARLESITKEYGIGIIISEYTHSLLKGEFLTRELGEVTVKGKSQPVKIFGVLPGSLRAYPRATLEAAATLVVAGLGEECKATTRDISEGGLAVDGVPAAWATGTAVEVRCEGGLLPKPLTAAGVIVWRRDGLAGIKFTALGADVAPAVAEYVASRGR
jgi:adenylate cyclase